MRPKGNSAELEQRRRHAIAMLKQGMKPAVVAKTLRTSLVSVVDGARAAAMVASRPWLPSRIRADH